MENKKMTPMKAIREKCIDCCCGSMQEVKLCKNEHCALYDFRLGHNPNISKRSMSEEQKKIVAERLKNARMAKEGK